MDEDIQDITEEDESEAGEQHPNSIKKGSWLAPYQFKKGQSGNPSGRPKGISLKEWAKNYLASLTDEERLEYLEGLNKGTVWKMAEGAPDNKNDITSGGLPIIQIAETIANKNATTQSSESNS